MSLGLSVSESYIDHVSFCLTEGYFLIFLNSAIMLYFIRKHFSHAPAAQEKVLYAFFFVLGAADCEYLAKEIVIFAHTSKYNRDTHPPHNLLSSGNFTQHIANLNLHIKARCSGGSKRMELSPFREHHFHLHLVHLSSSLVGRHCSRLIHRDRH